MKLTQIITALLVVLTVMLTGAGTAAAVVPPSFFGMHDHGVGSDHYPSTDSIQSMRLWDSGVTWKDVEVSPGVYNWDTLDKAVANTRAHGDTVFMVLGGTPQFYAKDPNHQTSYGPGFCEEADLGAWERYVTAVVTRYKGKIDSYEPVNEGDILTFYCGTWQHLVERSRIVYNVVQSIDPAAVVTSPSFVDRLASSQATILNYLFQYGGIKYAEAISYHPYGMPEYGPEQNADLIKSLRAKLANRGIYKPVWTSELNYGLPIGGGGVVAPMSEWKQAAYMSRTFITQYNAGAKRVYWYSWSDAPFLGVKTINQAGTVPMPVRAMETMKWWMRGQIKPCTVSKTNVWSCVIKYSGRDGVLRWSPDGTRHPRTPAGTLTKRNMYGNLVTYSRYVGIAPVLYR